MKNCIQYLFILSTLLLFSCRNRGIQLDTPSPAPQTYPYITAEKGNPDIPESPDPLVAWRWDDPKAEDDLEIYIQRPVHIAASYPASFQGLESLTGGKGPIRISGTGDLIIDFGQENAAWLEFDSRDLNGEVEMSISEYNEPAILNLGAQNRIKTMKPVKYGDTYRLELNDELYEGVRFGWIHVKSLDTPWHIDEIRLVCQVKPTNYNGSFRCSDPELTRIWYTGAYGVKLNLLKDFFGAILMERSDRFSWTGDAYVSQAASLVSFGNYDFILTNIDHTDEQDNGILSYSMYWIQSLVDYYNYTGDTTTLVHYIGNARTKLEKAYEHYGTDPRLGFYGWDERIGAGFEDNSCREFQNAYKMLCIDSWLDFAGMMESVGRTEIARIYEGYATEKISALREDPEWYLDFGIHAASDAINAGFTSREEQEAMFDLVFKDRLNRLSYSPFNQYFIIRALAVIGRYDEALETISDNWGGQLAYGGTSFFEVFRPFWNRVLGTNDAPINAQCGPTSLCHPWCGGVTHWITEEVLGIKPLLPGFRRFEVMPNPGSGITEMKGSVPVPGGTITASYNIEQGRYEIQVPEGLEATMGIPVLGRNIVEIEMDGEKVYNEDLVQGGLSEHITTDSDFIRFSGIGAGSHVFNVICEGASPAYKESAWLYPADDAVEEKVTSGNWGGKYG